jgi:predicted DNA-binding transcriptional regulator AlpA
MITAKLRKSLEEINDTASPSSEKANKLLTEKQAAVFLGLTPSALQVWRSTGRYSLPFIKVGSLVRYRESDLCQWLESRTRASGTTA